MQSLERNSAAEEKERKGKRRITSGSLQNDSIFDRGLSQIFKGGRRPDGANPEIGYRRRLQVPGCIGAFAVDRSFR